MQTAIPVLTGLQMSAHFLRADRAAKGCEAEVRGKLIAEVLLKDLFNLVDHDTALSRHLEELIHERPLSHRGAARV